MILEEVYYELRAAILHWPIWLMLAKLDIKLRYSRTSLGPFWVAIRTALTICTTGVLYSHLFKESLDQYLPYLAAGIICWGLISSLIIESGNIYLESGRYIKNQETFLSIFVIRMILRNLIIFVHNLFVFIPLILFFDVSFDLNFLLIIPGLILLCLNAFVWGSALAFLGAKYRDCVQIMSSVVQIAFFLTPVIWMPSSLPNRYHWIIDYNPLYQFICLIKNPLLSQALNFDCLAIVSLITLLGLALYALMTVRYKHELVFWI